MRILASADLHGFLEVYEWLVRVAREKKADLLILAGDLFTYDSPEAQRAQGREIVSILKRAEIPCFYIMGNDDNVGLGYEDEQIKPLHGRQLGCGGWQFVGYEYTPRSIVGDLFVKEESEIEKDLQSMEGMVDGSCILVTHTPARGILDETEVGERVGSVSLAEFLKRQPVLAHVHGHVHGAFGFEANHFNVASAGEKRAFVIEIPSLESEVLREE